jgi:hypothetical protein
LTRSTSAEIRIAAARTLGNPLREEARPHIERRLAIETDSRVRDALLQALLTGSDDIDGVEDPAATLLPEPALVTA